MKSTATTFVLALALVACEGEPPKTPSGPAAHEHEDLTTATEPTDPEHAGPHGDHAAHADDAGHAGVDPDAALPEAGLPIPVVEVAAIGTVKGVVVTQPAGVAANAVVYLEDAPIEPTAKMSVTIDNHQMLFSPFVAVIPAGGKIVFHNSDPFPHNVFSSDHERFDMGAIPQGQGRVRAFKAPGSYALLCNLHPGMLGYVLVTPSSYSAKADGKGHYTLRNVPNGTYKITAWAPRVTPSTQSVTVKGNDVSVDFDLHR